LQRAFSEKNFCTKKEVFDIYRIFSINSPVELFYQPIRVMRNYSRDGNYSSFEIWTCIRVFEGGELLSQLIRSIGNYSREWNYLRKGN